MMRCNQGYMFINYGKVIQEEELRTKIEKSIYLIQENAAT